MVKGESEIIEMQKLCRLILQGLSDFWACEIAQQDFFLASVSAALEQAQLRNTDAPNNNFSASPVVP